MTKFSSKRMEKVIERVIHPNQWGFIEGRFIGEGIRVLEDLIEYMECNSKLGFLLQVDFEKGFDSVEWKCFVDALK